MNKVVNAKKKLVEKISEKGKYALMVNHKVIKRSNNFEEITKAFMKNHNKNNASQTILNYESSVNNLFKY